MLRAVLFLYTSRPHEYMRLGENPYTRNTLLNFVALVMGGGLLTHVCIQGPLAGDASPEIRTHPSNPTQKLHDKAKCCFLEVRSQRKVMMP